MEFSVFHFYSNFTIEQKKGGIHAIYRSIMETFGWYRLTGFIQKNICDVHSSKPLIFFSGFFLKQIFL
jgi:hypothetical protein